jgi:hypothetical protein
MHFSRFFVALVITAFAASEAWGIQPLKTSTRNKGFGAVSVGAAGFGGVLFASEARFTTDNGATDALPKLEAIIYNEDANEVCLRFDGDCHTIAMDEDYFVRVVSFVENEGVGAFSAYSPEGAGSGLANGQMGIEECEHHDDEIFSGYFCATEFAGDQLIASALSALDFAQFDPHPHSDAIASEINAANLAKYNALEWTDWEPIAYAVMDIYSDIVVSINLDTNSISLSGDLLVFDRMVSSSNKNAEDPLKVVGVGNVSESAWSLSADDQLQWSLSWAEMELAGLKEEQVESGRMRRVIDCSRMTEALDKVWCSEKLASFDQRAAYVAAKIASSENEVADLKEEIAASIAQSLDANVLTDFERGVELARHVAMFRAVKNQRQEVWDKFIQDTWKNS